jgi:hypothetical protein
MAKTPVNTGNNTGFADATAPETFAFSDGGIGGYTAIADPATPANVLKPDASGNMPVTLATAPLPTGGSTSAKQDVGNVSLASVDTKTPALGQALAAASVPVVLTALQAAALTPPANTGYALDGTDVSAPTAILAGGVGIRGWLSSIWTKLNGTLAVSGTFFQATQPVSIAATVAVSNASLPLPAGAATSAKQPALGTAGTASADVLSVQGIASGTPLVTVGKLAAVSQTFTRPANATAYALNQSVNTNVTTGTVITFANMSRLASSVSYIVAAKLATDLSTCAGQFRLHLYSANTMTIPADGAAFQFKFSDIGIYIGYIDFVTLQTEGAGTALAAYAVDDAIRKAVLTDASSQVYGLLEAKGAIPTASGQNFAISFLVEHAS